MREEILRLIEKNSRIDIHEMAILLGAKEAEVANAIADMEKEGVICGYYTLIDWDKTNDEKVTALIWLYSYTWRKNNERDSPVCIK